MHKTHGCASSALCPSSVAACLAACLPAHPGGKRRPAEPPSRRPSPNLQDTTQDIAPPSRASAVGTQVSTLVHTFYRHAYTDTHTRCAPQPNTPTYPPTPHLNAHTYICMRRSSRRTGHGECPPTSEPTYQNGQLTKTTITGTDKGGRSWHVIGPAPAGTREQGPRRQVNFRC